MKNYDFFLIFAPNIDFGYEYHMKVGCNGVYITQTCYPDDIRQLEPACSQLPLSHVSSIKLTHLFNIMIKSI